MGPSSEHNNKLAKMLRGLWEQVLICGNLTPSWVFNLKIFYFRQFYSFSQFFYVIRRVPKSKKGTYDAPPSRTKNLRPIVFQHNTVCASSDIGPTSICILAKLGTQPSMALKLPGRVSQNNGWRGFWEMFTDFAANSLDFQVEPGWWWWDDSEMRWKGKEAGGGAHHPPSRGVSLSVSNPRSLVLSHRSHFSYLKLQLPQGSLSQLNPSPTPNPSSSPPLTPLISPESPQSHNLGPSHFTCWRC